MKRKKNIFAIVGSASKNSANLKLTEYIASITKEDFVMTIFDKLATLPHFNPELSIEGTPDEVLAFRKAIHDADGILICTPEYIFSIPSGLKNAIEWCVSTTIFSKKPAGLITASANGRKGHEELTLIMKTVEAHFTDSTTLIVQGIKGRITGEKLDTATVADVTRFVESFKELVGRIG